MKKVEKKIDKKIEKIKQFRKQYYQQHAHTYDKEWWTSQNALQEFQGFHKFVRITPTDIVLDLATGTGTFLIEMAKKGANCYGIDQSPKMLEKLKDKIQRQGIEKNVVNVREGTADELPYPDRTFTWVVCIGMLEYYPQRYAGKVLREIQRILKPTGHCFIDIPDPNKPYAQEREWIFTYNLQELEKMILKLGFNILTKNTAGFMIQYLLLKT